MQIKMATKKKSSWGGRREGVGRPATGRCHRRTHPGRAPRQPLAATSQQSPGRNRGVDDNRLSQRACMDGTTWRILAIRKKG